MISQVVDGHTKQMQFSNRGTAYAALIASFKKEAKCKSYDRTANLYSSSSAHEKPLPTVLERKSNFFSPRHIFGC